MDKRKATQYTDACRDLVKECSSKEELQKKVMANFKIKGKKDKGYESVRKAVKRQWDMRTTLKKSLKGKEKKGDID